MPYLFCYSSEEVETNKFIAYVTNYYFYLLFTRQVTGLALGCVNDLTIIYC